jgi:hypothetical protein
MGLYKIVSVVHLCLASIAQGPNDEFIFSGAVRLLGKGATPALTHTNRQQIVSLSPVLSIRHCIGFACSV